MVRSAIAVLHTCATGIAVVGATVAGATVAGATVAGATVTEAPTTQQSPRKNARQYRDIPAVEATGLVITYTELALEPPQIRPASATHAMLQLVAEPCEPKLLPHQHCKG